MNYRVLVADEAIEDIYGFFKYIHVELCNPDAAEKLYHNLNYEVKNMKDFPLKFSDIGIMYRKYVIHKKVYDTYLIFYIINDKNKDVYILRVLKDLMNWQMIMRKTKIYHFSNYNT